MNKHQTEMRSRKGRGVGNRSVTIVKGRELMKKKGPPFRSVASNPSVAFVSTYISLSRLLAWIPSAGNSCLLQRKSALGLRRLTQKIVAEILNSLTKQIKSELTLIYSRASSFPTAINGSPGRRSNGRRGKRKGTAPFAFGSIQNPRLARLRYWFVSSTLFPI